MSASGHPGLHLTAAVEATTVGVPGTDGRWQPTRAGAVNSWAWSEENLWFADGWLTLAGPNSSGKSLTASVLVTVLLEGDAARAAPHSTEEATSDAA